MMDEKVLSVNPVPLVKVKEMLKEIAKEGELTYEQTLTLKYADKFSKITRAKAEKLIEDLMKIEGMTEEIAIKITDLLPQNEEILSLIISKKVKISDEDMKKIIKTVKDYYVSEEPKQTKTKK
ncbi:RNA polymerase Rpb4 family protein [Candidatus Micrarchaeota archaeon]|nr:RNA polymerase Rpb4 family protein [Candidatus Micrarchaeota archaeon]